MTSAAPGWYPDPHAPSALRWFDGSEWTGKTAPLGGFQPVTRPALGRGWERLSAALSGMLGLAVLVNAFALTSSWWTASVLSSWLEDPTQISLHQAQLVDSMEKWSSLSQVAVLAVTGVLFVVWLFRAHRSDRMDAGVLEHGSGWAIGGWFVPILGLWRPLQMVLDVRRGALPHDRRYGSARLVVSWWVMFVAFVIAGRVASALYPGADVEDADLVGALHRSAVADMVYAAVAVVAGTLAIVVVRSITRIVSESPNGAR